MSIGFWGKELLAAADQQGYRLVKCVYHHAQQEVLVSEWRLIADLGELSENPEVKFRTNKTRIVPFLEFLLPNHQAKLSLEKILLGPSQEMDLSLSSLNLFLKNTNVGSRHPHHIVSRRSAVS